MIWLKQNLALLCYCLGDAVSKVMDRLDSELATKSLYPIYRRLMLWSVELDTKGSL